MTILLHMFWPWQYYGCLDVMIPAACRINIALVTWANNAWGHHNLQCSRVQQNCRSTCHVLAISCHWRELWIPYSPADTMEPLEVTLLGDVVMCGCFFGIRKARIIPTDKQQSQILITWNWSLSVSNWKVCIINPVHPLLVTLASHVFVDLAICVFTTWLLHVRPDHPHQLIHDLLFHRMYIFLIYPLC